MKHITIITPANRPGILADIAERMAARNVNIVQITSKDHHDHAVILLDAEPYNEDLLAIHLKDEPGALAKVAVRFRDSQINVQSMRIVRRDGGWATVILFTND